jgi:hypothetical protein
MIRLLEENRTDWQAQPSRSDGRGGPRRELDHFVTRGSDNPADAAGELLQQQCWLWGRDVERPQGNLLTEYGFVRSTPPQSEWGSSCFTYTHPQQIVVKVWGFGVIYVDPRRSGVFLQRSEFAPRIVDSIHGARDIYRPDQIEHHAPTKHHHEELATTLPPLLAWIGSYERWVLDTFGLEYRQRCLSEWEGKRIDPERLPAAWWNLAKVWREKLTEDEG